MSKESFMRHHYGASGYVAPGSKPPKVGSEWILEPIVGMPGTGATLRVKAVVGELIAYHRDTDNQIVWIDAGDWGMYGKLKEKP